MAELLPLKAGDRVNIWYKGIFTQGSVLLASGNSKSLMLGFEAILSGYVGMMPVLWSDESERYEDLIKGLPVNLTKLP